jgi:hypothetical protein
MSEDRDRNPSKDETSDLAEVTRVYGPFEADLIKNFLASHGVAAIIVGRTAPFVYPLTVDGMAEFKVLVQASDAEKARELIAAMPAPDDDGEPEKPA